MTEEDMVQQAIAIGGMCKRLVSKVRADMEREYRQIMIFWYLGDSFCCSLYLEYTVIG